MSVALFESFEGLKDPRLDRGKNHSLYEMVVVAITAAICGANSWVDVERFGIAKLEWYRKYLTLEHGIPSHDTFGRVFRMLDTAEFLSCLQAWLDSLDLEMQGELVAIDGKTLRRSFDNATGQGAVHIVSAWARGLRLCLGQVSVAEKSNEITAVPKLLRLLELKGAIVTLDAMHCQQATAEAILKKEADYVLAVKKNQPTLHRTLEELFTKFGEQDYKVAHLRRHATGETSHGRRERREYFVAPAPASLARRWPQIRSVCMVIRQREVVTTGDVHEELHFYISSLPPKVRAFAKYVRGHWSIENSLHWSLDVTFQEDASRIRKDNAPEIASIFRRLALTLLKRDNTQKDNVRGKRLSAGWNSDVLEQILGITKP